MLIISLAIFTAFIITFTSLPVVIKVTKEKGLVDKPSGRKIHASPIPNLGGLAMFPGIAIASSIFWYSNSPNSSLQFIIASSIVVFFLGLKDDVVGISAKQKFIAQVFAAAIIIFKQNMLIKSFNGLFGLQGLSEIGSIGLTFLTIILIINAYNLIDGIDGLSGFLSVFSISIFGAYFYLTGQHNFAILAGATLGSVLGFLIFNYHPAKIFMGDTGSLLLGLIHAIFAIQLINSAALFPDNIFATAASAPNMAMAILFVPLFDTVRVFIVRILSGRSPFAPENNHIHHLLQRSGLNHKSVISLLLGLNSSVVLLVAYLTVANNTLTFLFMLGVGLCFYLIVDQKKSSITLVNDINSNLARKPHEHDLEGPNLVKTNRAIHANRK